MGQSGYNSVVRCVAVYDMTSIAFDWMRWMRSTSGSTAVAVAEAAAVAAVVVVLLLLVLVLAVAFLSSDAYSAAGSDGLLRATGTVAMMGPASRGADEGSKPH